MKTSENGIRLLKEFEGCVLYAYDDLDGYWPHKKTTSKTKLKGTLTIGYGHTGIDVKPGMEITQEQAVLYLKNDLKRFENYVNNTGLSLNQNQFDALVSFTYNCGPGNLQKLIKNRNLRQVAEALLLYNKSNGKIIDGLTKRRKKERELFLGEMFIKTKYKVMASVLNVRSGAGTNHSIVSTVIKGTILTICTVENGFGKLSNGNFVSMQYLEKC